MRFFRVSLSSFFCVSCSISSNLFIGISNSVAIWNILSTVSLVLSVSIFLYPEGVRCSSSAIFS